jgi:hypothetical protein
MIGTELAQNLSDDLLLMDLYSNTKEGIFSLKTQSLSGGTCPTLCTGSVLFDDGSVDGGWGYMNPTSCIRFTPKARPIGTKGYIVLELTLIGKTTKAKDVHAFDTIILEVAYGRHTSWVDSHGEERLLVDFVLEFWRRGLLVHIMDLRLGGEFVKEEAELAFKLGLLCSHPSPGIRPSMRHAYQYLCGELVFPELPERYRTVERIEVLEDLSPKKPCTAIK